MKTLINALARAARTASRITVGVTLGGTIAMAQSAPPIRQIGKLERVTPDSVGLATVRNAVGMRGGRVLVDDIRARRVLLFDSTLSRATVVADTTSATADAYGMNFASLIQFRGDSALLIVPSTLSMFVIAPNGTIARTMAVPRPDGANLLLGSWSSPGVDARGRLAYLGQNVSLNGVLTLNGKIQAYENGQLTTIGSSLLGMVKSTDSVVIVRASLDTRALDTAAWIRIPKVRRGLKTDGQGFVTAIETTPDPLPVLDQWIVLRDGTIAIVRGSDFHIDWLDAAGHMTSSAKVAFEWRKVDDARKELLVDSAVKFWRLRFDDDAAFQTGGANRSGSRGGGVGGGGRGGAAEPIANVVKRPALTDLADYFPPFAEHSIAADDDGNLWIRTSAMVDGRPVYYVVNRRGDVIDRVQLPAFRTIAGFGPGVIYMAVELASGEVHLERARLR